MESLEYERRIKNGLNLRLAHAKARRAAMALCFLVHNSVDVRFFMQSWLGTTSKPISLSVELKDVSDRSFFSRAESKTSMAVPFLIGYYADGHHIKMRKFSAGSWR